MKKVAKLLSWIFLAATLCLLAAVGIYNLVKNLSPRLVSLPEAAFGIFPAVEVKEGREYDLEKEIHHLEGAAGKLLLKAFKYRTQGKSEQAATHLKEVIKINQRAMPAYHFLAECVWNQSPPDTQQADSLYQKALELDPGHPALLYYYGRFLWNTGKREKAMAQYQSALNASPAFPAPYIGWGEELFRQEKYSQASQKYRMAISLMKGDSGAPYDLLALTYYKMGRDDSAGMVIDHAKRLGMNNPLVQFIEALLWEESGELRLAEEMYRKLIARYPNSLKYKRALATLGRKPPRSGLAEAAAPKERHWEEATAAIEILDPLVLKYRNNAPLWFALGQAYMQRELYAHAVDCFDSSIKYGTGTKVFEDYRNKALAALEVNISLKADSLTDTAALAFEDSISVSNQDEIVLGHYYLRWGDFREEVMKSYPEIKFEQLENGNIRQVYRLGRVTYETILGFRKDRLWGIMVSVSDNARETGDLFGELLGRNSRISGKGNATGSARCEGNNSFQGVVWENEDTIELMVQYADIRWKINMLRAGREFLPQKYRLCDLIALLDKGIWR